MEFDPLETLTWNDVKISKNMIVGRQVETVTIHIKSPKVGRVGAGDDLEVFETGCFMCPISAFSKWRKFSKLSEANNQPVFRIRNDTCLTGGQLNKMLEELTRSVRERLDGKFTSHSLRAGLCSELTRAGHSEENLKSVGRWSSESFKLYIKHPRLKRAKLVWDIAQSK